MSGARAHATGFAFRALEETLADEAGNLPPGLSPQLSTRGALTRSMELRLVSEMHQG